MANITSNSQLVPSSLASPSQGFITVDGASDGLGGSEDLLHDAGEVLGHGPGPHDAGRADDVIEGDVAVVLDVLHLLAITWRLLQGLDDEGGGRGNDVDGGLTVLDGQLDGDLEAFPVLGGLGDVVTDLLGGETEGTDLGGQGRGGGNFTTNSPQADNLEGKKIGTLQTFLRLRYLME